MTTQTISAGYPAGVNVVSPVTVVTITSSGSVGGTGLYYAGSNPLQVINSGTLIATSPGHNGVKLKGGGSVTNASGGTISGNENNSGILFEYGTSAVVDNYGVIFNTSSLGNNVSFLTSFGGYSKLRNRSTGTLSASCTIAGSCVYFNTSGTLIVDNEGLIEGSTVGNVYSVSFGHSNGPSYVKNSGTIVGRNAVSAQRTSLTLRNDGVIEGLDSGVTANPTYAAICFNGSSLDASAYIYAGGAAIKVAGTVVNYGTSNGGPGVWMTGTIASTLDNRGTIRGPSFGAVFRTHGSLLNGGLIEATTTQYGRGLICNDPSIVVTNEVSGTISGSAIGVDVVNYPGTVVNYGLITAPEDTTYSRVGAVYFEYGGSIDNAAGATINGARVGVSANTYGHYASTVVNHGTINAPDAIQLRQPGSAVTNAFSGVVTDGTLSFGVSLASAVIDFTGLHASGPGRLNLAQGDPGTYVGISLTNFGTLDVLGLSDLPQACGSGDNATYSGGQLYVNSGAPSFLAQVSLTKTGAVNAFVVRPDRSAATRVIALAAPIGNVKTISTTYAAGYTISGLYPTISITGAGSIGGTGLYNAYPCTYSIYNAGSIGATLGAGTQTINAGVGFAAGYAYVTNQGTITGAGTAIGPVCGIRLAPGGTVVNGTSAYVGGSTYGIAATGGTLAVQNSGIVAAYRAGVVNVQGTGLVNNLGTVTATGYGVLLGGGLVTNETAALIAAQVGAKGGTAALALLNSGTVACGNVGVYLDAGGTVTNSGLIGAGERGVYVSYGQSGTVLNSGSITCTHQYAVMLRSGGYLSNSSAGVVYGGWGGLSAYGQPTTVYNAGTISGLHYYGMGLGSGGYVKNARTGVVGVGTDGGMWAEGTYVTVNNYGAISGTRWSGLWTNTGARVVNHPSAAIGGGYGALAFYGTSPSSVDNSGTLSSTYAVHMEVPGGYFTQAVSGVVSSGSLRFATSLASGDFNFAHLSTLALAQGNPVTYAGIYVRNFGPGCAVDLSQVSYASGDFTSYGPGVLGLYSSAVTLLAQLSFTKRHGVTLLAPSFDGVYGTVIRSDTYSATFLPMQCGVIT